MDYKLIRSNRKTVAIQLQKDGSVIVRAPKRLAVYRIEAFVKEKQSWIEQHQKRLQEQQRQKEQRRAAVSSDCPADAAKQGGAFCTKAGCTARFPAHQWSKGQVGFLLG